MNADVRVTRVADGVAVITLGSARRIDDDEGDHAALPSRSIEIKARSVNQ
jgi:hypothetical protein